MKFEIKNLKAREIIDSRGNFTVEVSLITEEGVFKASCPSGASTGKKEAMELRDNNGRVLTAVDNVNNVIYPYIKDLNILDQENFDKKLIEIGGENKSKLGANAILPISVVVLRASAFHYKLPLYKYISKVFDIKNENVKMPFPCFNIVNGGAHASNNLTIQEFMVIPQKENYKENLIEGVNIYHKLKKQLKENYGKTSINIGDEGGFAPSISNIAEVLDNIASVIEKDTKIGLDCAADYFYKNGSYEIEKNIFTREGLVKFYKELVERYPIISIEDPFSEDDIEGWKIAKEELKNTLIIGDDLTVTNKKMIEFAIKNSLIGGVIIKPNQIGTVFETIEAVKLAKENNIKIMVSHRSGDTTDDFISDLAVGISADYIKTGATARGERVVKYNRLLEIDEEMANGK